MKRKILILLLTVSAILHLSTSVSEFAKVEEFTPQPSIAKPLNYK